MIYWVVALLAVLVVVAVWAWPSAAARRHARVAHRPRKLASTPYHCVAIVHGSTSCEAVRKLEGRRLLPEEALRYPLPLPECDLAVCRCHYAHFDDRRHEQRRGRYREGVGSGPEKRFGRERRGQRTFPEVGAADG